MHMWGHRGRDIFVRFHISAERVSRSGLLNQSVLQAYYKVYYKHVLQKGCTSFNFSKAECAHFLEWRPWMNWSIYLLREPETLLNVGTSKCNGGKFVKDYGWNQIASAPVSDEAGSSSFFFNYSSNFITFIVVQRSSQPNFIAFPSQTLSVSPYPPTCLLWKP